MDEDGIDHNATDFPSMEAEVFFLSEEDGALAEQLSELGHVDFARMMLGLSESAKNELRSAVGTLEAAAFPRRSPDDSGS